VSAAGGMLEEPVSEARSTQEARGTHTQAPVSEARGTQGQALLRVREGAAGFWIWALAGLSQRTPWVVALGKPLFVRGTWWSSVSIRRGTMANARRILGEGSTRRERARLGRAVLGQVYEFFAEVGRNCGRPRKEMLCEVESIVGHEKLVAARASGRGAVIAVAHMGSYEVAAAALREYEEHVHVVFKREARGHYEKMRKELHERLGVHETPVDDGLGVWFHLRDRLRANDVVLIQSDRVMPGQKGVRVPFLGGHVEFPTGPVKLALAAGCPIIPVFALRVGRAKVRIVIEDPIEVEGVGERGEVHPALIRLARLVERYVREYPDQWLLVTPAWVEDQERA
jgi:lauroyl/myristoyl acyltransferase